MRNRLSKQEEDIYAVFTSIAQSISTGSEIKLFKEVGVDEKLYWALYLQTLAPFHARPEEINSEALKFLESMCPYQIDQLPDTALSIGQENEKTFTESIKLVKGLMSKKFLGTKIIDDDVFLEDCGLGLEDFVKNVYPENYDKETKALIFVLSTATRSILKDSLTFKDTEQSERRDIGFFWIAMMLISWMFIAV